MSSFDKTHLILVASATATTATNAVISLVERGHTNIRAMVKRLDDPRLECMKLPGVNFVQGDFDKLPTIDAALSGASRAMLVTGAFDHLQFERETNFIQAAKKAGCEAIVRISTASGLIKPGTKGAYGRAHHGIESFSSVGNFPVVHLNPNWFMTNFLGNAGEAKATGKISLPVDGKGPKNAFIDPRDVGSAAALILTLSSADLQPFLQQKNIEVHGRPDARCNMEEKVAAISKAVGYPIEIQQVPREAWAGVLTGMGLPEVFANSFLETVEQCNGQVPPGYEFYGPEQLNWCQESSDILIKAGWQAKYDVSDFANSDLVKGAFGK